MTAPSTPAHFSALPVSASAIQLTWSVSTDDVGVTFYRIYRGGQVHHDVAGATVWTDTALAASTTYCYQVSAFDASAHESARTSTSCATTQAAAGTPPAAPGGASASALSSSSIRVTWTDNSSTETGFKIERSLSAGSGFSQVGTVGAGVTQYDSTGLTASTTYYFRVRATNAAGDSTYSNVASATTSAATVSPPAAPSSASASALSSSSIRLTWTDNSANEAGFKIERSLTAGSGFAEVATVGANVASYDSTGLAASTTYYFRVRATNAAGDSAYSNTASATTQAAAAVPAAPTGLVAGANSMSSISIQWTDNSANETGFKIERSTSAGSGFAQIATVAANVTYYENKPLNVGTTYYYRVRATNAQGDSAYSNTASATTDTGCWYATSDNTIADSNVNTGYRTTVFTGGNTSTGCLWNYSSFTDTHLYTCYATLLKFAISTLPGKNVTDAKLYLTVSEAAFDGWSTSYRLAGIASAWSASSVTWGNFGWQYYLAGELSISPPPLGTWWYDVTPIVKNWANGSATNNGIYLEDKSYLFPYATLFRATSFYSNEVTGGSSGNRPMLCVYWQ